MFTNFGKLFTNSVHQKVQKGDLVNSVHELWQTVHEQCSSESAKREFVREQFENKGLVRERFAKIGFVKNIQNIKIEISVKCQHQKLTRESRIYSNQSQIFFGNLTS